METCSTHSILLFWCLRSWLDRHAFYLSRRLIATYVNESRRVSSERLNTNVGMRCCDGNVSRPPSRRSEIVFQNIYIHSVCIIRGQLAGNNRRIPIVSKWWAQMNIIKTFINALSSMSSPKPHWSNSLFFLAHKERKHIKDQITNVFLSLWFVISLPRLQRRVLLLFHYALSLSPSSSFCYSLSSPLCAADRTEL